MIILADDIAMTADRQQYIIGELKKDRLRNCQYFTKLENALQEAVRISVRLGVADGSITELRQIVAEQARLEQEFSEKLKGVYADYDDLKGKAGRADEADSRAAALQQQLDAMKADNDRREMKQRVSAATGVPAALLTGETEEACTAQAQEILKFSAPAYPNVRDGGTAGAIGNIPASQRHTTDLSPAFSRGNKHTPKKPQFFSY